MGKYAHICVLTGAENYSRWCRQMTLALQCERLWSHCSNGTDATELAELASNIPTPADPLAITDVEKEEILDWLAKDAQAKALIDRRVSPIVANLLNESQTARQQWDHLAQRCSCKGVMSPYELRTCVRSEKLKDAKDVTRYVGVFADARRRFAQMGVTYTTEESVFDLLQGLPNGARWEILGELNKLSSSTSTSTNSPLPGSTVTSTFNTAFTFDDAANILTARANASLRSGVWVSN